jgi:hypothetical protein
VEVRKEFEIEYQKFIDFHCLRRKGENLQRLKNGHGFAEKLFLENVWWPAIGHFDHLHPEYEINDYKDGYRYLDFAYIKGYFRLAIEIDGFGPHWRNITKWHFADHCQRQNHLMIDGWGVVRFPYDEVNEHPRLCQQTIQQLIGRFLGSNSSTTITTIIEQQVIRLATQSVRPITPREICKFLHVGPNYAQKLLHELVGKEWLQPASGNVRVRSYRLHPSKRYMRI